MGNVKPDMYVRFHQLKDPQFWEREFKAGERFYVDMEFECTLGTNLYEIQAAISYEGTPNYFSQRILHWRDEAAFFHVNVLRDEYFFGGILDLKMTASGKLMNDISITDYLGPGVYLLQNYPKETEGLIAEKGYKVHNCADLAQCKDILNRNKVNFLLTNDKDNNFNEYVKIVRTAARQLVNKIVINIFVEKGNGQSFRDFINITYNLGYSIDTVFYLLNPAMMNNFGMIKA